MGGRTAAIVSGLLGILLLGLPIATGFLLERGFPVVLATLNQRAEGAYRIEGRIERGFWTSSAETTLHLSGETKVSEAGIHFHHDLAHGPIPIGELLLGRSPFGLVLAVAETRLGGNSSDRAGLDRALGDRPLLRLTSRFYLDQSAWVDIESPAFEWPTGGFSSRGFEGDLDFKTAGQGAHLRVESAGGEWSAGKGSAVFESATLNAHFYDLADEIEIDGLLELGPLSLVGLDVGEVRVAPSRLTLDARRQTGIDSQLESKAILEIFLGDLEVPAPSPEMATPLSLAGGQVFLEAHSSQEGSARIRSVVGLQSLKSPDLVGEALSVRAAIRNLDPRAIRRLLDDLWLVAADPKGDPSGRQVLESRIALFIQRLPALCALSPEFEVSLIEWMTPGGKLSGRGSLKVDGSDPAVFATAFETLVATQAEGNLRIPAPIFESFMDRYLVDSVADEGGMLPRDQMLEMAGFLREMAVGRLLDQGLLRRQGNLYLIEARLEEGLPIINGKLLGPDMMMGILSGF